MCGNLLTRRDSGAARPTRTATLIIVLCTLPGFAATYASAPEAPGQPGTDQPDVAQPGIVQPDLTQSDPAASAPATKAAGSGEPPLASGPEAERVSERAEARWAALVKGDFSAAYAFETPAYRDTVDEPQHRAQFGNAARWRSAETRSVELADDRATVKVLVRFEMMAPAGAGIIPGEQIMTERWIKIDEEWWYARN
jgi:hypothetical protein